MPLNLDCEDFKYHLVEVLDTEISDRYKALLEEWEQEILWGVQR
jgi:hypothetical protein